MRFAGSARLMPSPVGHAIAGLTVAWISETVSGTRTAEGSSGALAAPWARTVFPDARSELVRTSFSGLAVTSALLAAAPDADILFHSHRMFTHSLGMAALVWLAALVVAASRSGPALRIATTCGLAYASHVFLAWLGHSNGGQSGLMALWPFSSRRYISDLGVFWDVSRRWWQPGEFVRRNLEVFAHELLLLAPLALVVWAVKVRVEAQRREESRSFPAGWAEDPPRGST